MPHFGVFLTFMLKPAHAMPNRLVNRPLDRVVSTVHSSFDWFHLECEELYDLELRCAIAGSRYASVFFYIWVDRLQTVAGQTQLRYIFATWIKALHLRQAALLRESKFLHALGNWSVFTKRSLLINHRQGDQIWLQGWAQVVSSRGNNEAYYPGGRPARLHCLECIFWNLGTYKLRWGKKVRRTGRRPPKLPSAHVPIRFFDTSLPSCEFSIRHHLEDDFHSRCAYDPSTRCIFCRNYKKLESARGVYKHMQSIHAVELETWQCDIEHIYLGIPPPASECLEVLD